MKLTLPLFAALALALPVRAAEHPLVGDMGRMMDLFDGGRKPMPRIAPPGAAAAAVRRAAPVDAAQWAPVPEAGAGAPAAARPDEAADAFANLEACTVVDVVYIRQPSLPEAVTALAPCLEAVSKRYGAAATAGAADTKALVIRIPVAASQTALARDLSAAIAKRGGSLIGYPARVSAELAPVQPQGTSVLQPILERCAGPKMLPRSASDFVLVYGDCLRSAKGLSIAAVRAHPTEEKTVLVLSNARFETLLDMSGIVTVPSAPGVGRFRIEARRDVAAGLPLGG
ncbi:hypothetical protein EPO15_05400 [bacterium]|nr:MAG: hypothetical protein EPO15_05400 [bacterium]